MLHSNLKNIELNQRLNCNFDYHITEESKLKDGDRNLGKYHEFNKLNDLTSKEWLKFQKSWFILNPKPRTKNVLLHPAKFPEELVEYFIRFFTKRGDTILDPMVGTGSSIISSMNTGRNSIGIELSKKYTKITENRIRERINNLENRKDSNIKKINIKLYNGDSRNLEQLKMHDIDYCITSPPYWNMLRVKGFETQKARKDNNLDLYYSDNEEDLGNIDEYEIFLEELSDIYLKVHNVLKTGGYLTVIVKNIKKNGKIFPLAWDLVNKLKFFTLKDEKIWCQDNVKLAPYGYGYSWVSNTVHHYCLIFKKE